MRDDGGGLDLAALHARGVAMGLIPADVPLGDPAVRELVFASGLSTRAQAGAVSGRGVGCDVVRRAVERLGGSIRVESEPGRGAAFLITLPVSLAITKALLVRARGRSYAIPLHFAERMVEAGREHLRRVGGRAAGEARRPAAAGHLLRPPLRAGGGRDRRRAPGGR